MVNDLKLATLGDKISKYQFRSFDIRLQFRQFQRIGMRSPEMEGAIIARGTFFPLDRKEGNKKTPDSAVPFACFSRERSFSFFLFFFLKERRTDRSANRGGSDSKKLQPRRRSRLPVRG